ncbi:MAG: response regulator [Bordetella sp.]|nr:response regulator [Bordetella sp.]
MPTIEVLTDRVEPVAKTAMTGEILARFQREPDTLVIPVVDGDRPIGLIERGDFLLKLAGPLGQSLYGARDVAHVMDPEPAVIEAGVRVDAFSSIILKSGPGALMRGFIVTRGGAYRGVGTAAALLRAINEDQRHENQRLIEQLRASDAAEQAVRTAAREKSRFMGLLNRELSTSMNGVLAVAELLHRQPLNDAAKSHARTIMDSAEDMLGNLRDALDLARAEAGELKIGASATTLRTLMDELQSHWSPRAAQDGVTLMVGYEGDTELAAMVDADRLRQVFNNLIGNALRFARHGMVEASLKAQTRGDQVLIEARVRDDGPVDDRRKADLLDPEADDAGLGLAISRRLIECMDGRIWAENNTGRGATFAFDLLAPIAFVEREEPNNISDLDQFHLLARPHVLIADDNATNRVVAQALCEMFGCTSETVEDGQEAVEAVQSRPFDLILMDIKMPRLDGVGATRAIRAMDGPQGDIPIIALTANADPDDAKAYLKAGMAAVVEKPIKPERLRLAMNTALEPASAAPARARDVA